MVNCLRSGGSWAATGIFWIPNHSARHSLSSSGSQAFNADTLTSALSAWQFPRLNSLRNARLYSYQLWISISLIKTVS